MKSVSSILILLLLTFISMSAHARNVDLSTVPKRDSVQLTIYNSEDLTLVRETRGITFKKGVNPLQFSWANTLIDPTSVQLRFLTSPEKLEVLDTTFPHDKPQMLYWNVQSEFDGEATVEISYFTSGITWAADYLAVADKAEKQMSLEGFVRVTNNSGEEYEDAHVRLVVGTINLVQKIAELAHVTSDEAAKMDKDRFAVLKLKAAEESLAKAADKPASEPMGLANSSLSPKEIVKEGLSEYFIFSIEGTETIPNGWSKRLRSTEAQSVPFKVQYRYRPQEYGDQLVRMYLLTNSKDSKLGSSPLPDGIVRVFRDNGRGGLSYLVSQNIKYIPIGEKIELNLGQDPNVPFELVKLKASRDEIWMKVNGADVYRKVAQPAIQIEPNTTVAGWDEHELYTQRVRNYTGVPIELEIRRAFAGHVIFRGQLAAILHDYQTVQFTAHVEPGKTSNLLFEVVRRQGYKAKQNNVTLEAADVTP